MGKTYVTDVFFRNQTTWIGFGVVASRGATLEAARAAAVAVTVATSLRMNRSIVVGEGEPPRQPPRRVHSSCAECRRVSQSQKRLAKGMRKLWAPWAVVCAVDRFSHRRWRDDGGISGILVARIHAAAVRGGKATRLPYR